MTVSTTSSESEPYVADGVRRSWPFSFRANALAHLQLVVRRGEVEEIVSAGLSSASKFPADEGSVVYPPAGSAPIAAGATVRVRRSIPLTQETRFSNQGPFMPERHEDAYDLLTMIDQQQQRQIDTHRDAISGLADNFEDYANSRAVEDAALRQVYADTVGVFAQVNAAFQDTLDERERATIEADRSEAAATEAEMYAAALNAAVYDFNFDSSPTTPGYDWNS